nr:MAG TPA: winged helix-turn-helix protein [Caudoviricetes sp.]
MDATQVKKYRDLLKAAETNIALRLYCDNGIIIDEGTMFVQWSDADNVVIAIKSNEDQVNHPGVKIKTIIADYEMIQYIIAYSTGKSIKPIAKKLNYTDEQIKNLINKFADPDINSFLNTTPKEVLEEIRHEYDERAIEAARVHQLQEDRAKAEGHVTVDQIRNR